MKELDSLLQYLGIKIRAILERAVVGDHFLRMALGLTTSFEALDDTTKPGVPWRGPQLPYLKL